jgi:hypothetical protein
MAGSAVVSVLPPLLSGFPGAVGLSGAVGRTPVLSVCA